MVNKDFLFLFSLGWINFAYSRDQRLKRVKLCTTRQPDKDLPHG